MDNSSAQNNAIVVMHAKNLREEAFNNNAVTSMLNSTIAIVIMLQIKILWFINAIMVKMKRQILITILQQ